VLLRGRKDKKARRPGIGVGIRCLLGDLIAQKSVSWDRDTTLDHLIRSRIEFGSAGEQRQTWGYLLRTWHCPNLILSSGKYSAATHFWL
jgi:hypothetical protein